MPRSYERLLPKDAKPLKTNFISRLYFTWLNGLLKLGHKRPLTDDDLLELSDENKAQDLVEDLNELWMEEISSAEKKGVKPRLWKAMWKLFPQDVLLFTLLKFMEYAMQFALILSVWFYLKLLQEKESHMKKTYTVSTVAGIGISCLIRSLCYHHSDYLSLSTGMRLKTAVIGLIHQKITESRRSDLSKFTSGHIVNLVSNDAKRMEELGMSLAETISIPFVIVAAVVSLSLIVGWQTLSGVLMMFLLATASILLTKLFARIRYTQTKVTDERMALMSEIISGIRAVKMCAWEWKYNEAVETLRRYAYFHEKKLAIPSTPPFLAAIATPLFLSTYLVEEELKGMTSLTRKAAAIKTQKSTKNLQKIVENQSQGNWRVDVAIWVSLKEIKFNEQKTCIKSIFETIRCNLTAMAAVISVSSIVYWGIRVDVVTVFTMVILFDICGNCIAWQSGYVIINVIDASISIQRIEEFLCNNSSRRGLPFNENITLSEKVDSELTNSISKYSKTDMFDLTQSSCDRNRVVLTNISASWIKDKQCVLHHISFTLTSNQLLMVAGPVGSGKTSLLMAILGEIPVTEGTIQTHGSIAYVSQTPWIFSGSIRENIAFGRPYDEGRYNRILEICDLHKDIKCFPRGDLTIIGQRGVGLSGGQRARVSLARAVYSDADIFLLDDPLSAVDVRVGQHILDECICGELSTRASILVTHQVQHLPRADKIAVVREGTAVVGTYAELKDKRLLDKLQRRHEDVTCDSELHRHILDSNIVDIKAEFAGNDMKEEDEDRATGTVSWRLYWNFFRVGTSALIICCFGIFYIIAHAFVLAPSWWMSRIAHMSLQEQRSFFSLGVFGGLVGGALVLSMVKDFSLVLAILRSSKKLHDKLTVAVIKSPVLFFDTNPAGRIINRFSKDIGAMDDLLPIQFNFSILYCVHMILVVLYTVAVSAWIIVAVIPMGMLFYFITAYYLKSSRELKRMEAIRCSPVYEHVTETVAGLEVIRTSNMEEECINEMMRLQTEYNKAFFLVMASGRWLGVNLDVLCSIFIVSVAILGLLAIHDHAMAGMLISLSMSLFELAHFGIYMMSEVETQMTSVERVMTYTKLPSEPGYSRQDKPPDDWPSQGSLSVSNLSMVYLEGGPPALRDVNFDVQAKEKIGIVGRTGAGKSSLVAALFRMPDPQGQVLIDGVDLGTIDIQDARRSMAVITQNPVLFGGSLKKNLDPFNCFPDQVIWTALEEVQLKKKVIKLPQQLEFCVGEGGSGFSVGERQLLCLARALLQKCKILVLDEATANVDYKTDQLIQQVIRQKFTNCTVLTIAHRLNTIMDYDKVVVLDQGRVVEYDNPRVLAEKENGCFSRLINSSSDNIELQQFHIDT